MKDKVKNSYATSKFMIIKIINYKNFFYVSNQVLKLVSYNLCNFKVIVATLYQELHHYVVTITISIK